MIKAQNPPIKLGEFLVATGFLSPTQVNETMAMANQTGLPLGRALVLNNVLTQKDLDAALRLQTIYRGSKIPLAVAVNAFKHCVQEQLTPEQGLAKAGFARQIISYSKLGTLLVDAKLITKKQLDDAQATSYETGMQLGKMLTLSGAISDEMLSTALELQRRMREQSITKDAALKEMERLFGTPKASASSAPSAVSAAQLELPKPTERTVKLGELLLMSGVITEIDVMDAFEHSLESNKPMATILVEYGVVPENLVGIAGELQEAISEGDMTIEAACESLSFIARTGEMPEGSNEIAQQPVDNSIKLGDILLMSSYLQEQDIEFAARLVKSYPSLIGKLLVVAGSIDEPTMRAALRCLNMLKQNTLNKENAIKVFKHSGQRRISFDDALDELGFNDKK